MDCYFVRFPGRQESCKAPTRRPAYAECISYCRKLYIRGFCCVWRIEILEFISEFSVVEWILKLMLFFSTEFLGVGLCNYVW